MDDRIKAIAVHYGLRHQFWKLGGELVELGYAILDHVKAPSVKTRGHVVEEMQDCMILFEQICFLMNVTEEEKDLYRDYKLSRQMLRMKQEPDYEKRA